MNLKRIASAVCAAAVLVSTSLSDLAVYLSEYSYAYAEITDYTYAFSQSPIVMTVKAKSDGTLSCETTTDIALPDVTRGVTTVAELRELYSGVTVNGFSMENSSVDGMTADDLHTSISLLSGTSYDGWYAVTDEDALTFADMPSDNDDKVVQAVTFHIYLENDTLTALGLSEGDIVRLNYDENREYYEYTYSGAPMEMTVTAATWGSASGKSCAFSNDFSIPGVTYGTTTVGELKEMFEGIKVSGYKFVDSTVDGMTADDLVPTIVVMTGESYSWNAVYNTNVMTFSETLASIPDEDVVHSTGFSVSVQDGSFEKLGLEIGDTFVVNPDDSVWKANFSFDETTGTLSWDSCPDVSGTVLYMVMANGQAFTWAITTGDSAPGANISLYLAAHSIYNATISGELNITVSCVTNSMESSDSFPFSYDGCDVNNALDAPKNLLLNGSTVQWDKTNGAVGYIARLYGNGVDEYTTCIREDCSSVWSTLSSADAPFGSYEFTVTAIDSNGDRSDWSQPLEIVYSNTNSFTYSDNPDGTITITGGVISDGDVVIPAEIDGKKVTEIGFFAFSSFNNTTANTIKTLVIPEGVKKLDWYAFNTCENLESVTLPESLEYIDSWAFERCYKLKTINVPANVSVINGGAFAQNKAMTSITCDSANKNYVSVNGVLFTKDMKALVAYPGGKIGGYTVPATVNHIGDAAFYGAYGLDSVEILGALDFIGFEAFAECSKLTDVVINDGVNYVGYWAFRGCQGIKQLTVPQSVMNIGDQAFGFADSINTKINGFTLRGYKDSAVYYYAIRHSIPFICIGEADPSNDPFIDEHDKVQEVETNPNADPDKVVKSITINAFNAKDKSEAGIGLNADEMTVKAKEIYDESDLERVSDIIGIDLSANKKYSLLDLTLLQGEKDISDKYDGLIEVKISIPTGHRDENIYCYRILDDGTKELIPGKQTEEYYILYLEHFSVYALLADEEHTCTFSENWSNDKDSHWHECSCGKTAESAPHTAGEWITDKAPTAEENGHRYKECTVCGYILAEEELIVEKTAAPVITPNGGSFTGSVNVTITTATDGAKIYYTTNGSDPTTSSTQYDKSFTISATTTVKAIAIKDGMENSAVVSATFTKKSSGGTSGGSSGGGGGSSGGSSRPSTPTSTNPSIGGSAKSWSDVAADIAKLTIGSKVTIELNGSTTVPVDVIKAIADKDSKVTFVIDSIFTWVVDGAEITTPAAADLSILASGKLKTDALRGISGTQFTLNSTNIPTDLEIAFKTGHAGKFANLYKSADGKLVFVTCAKIGADGKVILPDVTDKGDYVVMLCEFSDCQGDMNNDGVLTSADASAILRDIVGLETGANPLMADFNGDGNMNAKDASEILKRIVGLA